MAKTAKAQIGHSDAGKHPQGQEAKGPCQMAKTATAQTGHMPSKRLPLDDPMAI